MDIRKTLCMLAFGGVIGLSAQTSGQNYTLSPYSNFGLGELIQPNFLFWDERSVWKNTVR
jgi:hypothetical protein